MNSRRKMAHAGFRFLQWNAGGLPRSKISKLKDIVVEERVDIMKQIYAQLNPSSEERRRQVFSFVNIIVLQRKYELKEWSCFIIEGGKVLKSSCASQGSAEAGRVIIQSRSLEGRAEIPHLLSSSETSFLSFQITAGRTHTKKRKKKERTLFINILRG
ncbi:hypothetical protein CEXT_510331 [Caerostris extrusa]|uniref:Uncharacterized protein n=1 Tax=Caerostris extrusa TaxID=172846 RepID=A0AAV4NSX2_CAEEX|nr:hypothetical protein CEXT_510331 [Caerostris extrusa]